MREEFDANSAIVKRLAQIDNTLFLHDAALRDLYQKLRPLLAPPPEPEKRRIGFHSQNKCSAARKPEISDRFIRMELDPEGKHAE